MQVPFLDLQKQHQRLKPGIDKAIRDIARRSDFILGKEVKNFEEEFSRYCGVKYAVGLNSGTDALFLSLMAMGIGAGNEVIVPAFTFIATANAVSYTGAKPVFVDIDEKTYNVDVLKIERAITKRTKVIIPVHLYGQCCDMAPIMKLARKYNLKVIEDACQAHGALYMGKKAGAMGDIGCFSFYPTKNLGGWGDGGMTITNNKQIYDKLVMLRDCGRKSRYEHVILGYNSRLDTIQAAILRVELKYLDQWNRKRAAIARKYTRLLSGIPGIILPQRAHYSRHVFHIYALRVKNRDLLVSYLKAKGIGVAVHYPLPLHLQPAYKSLGYKRGDFPVAEKVAKEVISLPMHPYLTPAQVKYVAGVLRQTERNSYK